MKYSVGESCLVFLPCTVIAVLGASAPFKTSGEYSFGILISEIAKHSPLFHAINTNNINNIDTRMKGAGNKKAAKIASH